MFCSLVNQVQFVCNLQRLKQQHPGEAATSVIPEHQESHRIGHFRVPLCLCFKASLSAKPFL